MNENEKMVSQYIFELELARSERHIKRLWIVLIITIILLFASNAIWIYEWTRYDYASEEIEYNQDGSGLNNINTGTQGNVDYGTDIENQEADSN